MVASWDMLGGDAGRESSIYKARHKAGALSGTGPGYPAIPQTSPFQCCIPKHLFQNGHRACLIPSCDRASRAAGLWRGMQWLLLGH